MQAPDPATVGAAVGAAVATVLGKMGIDKVRGNGHSGVQKALDEHKRDDLDKFASLTAAVQRAADVAVETKLETLKVASKIAEDVAFIRGQLSKD